MALVSFRTIIKNETVVRLMIWREGQELYSHLFLRHVHGEVYETTRGGKEALRIFGLGERIHLRPIANRRFSHLVTQ